MMKNWISLLCGIGLSVPSLFASAEPFGLVMARSGENYVTRGILEFEAQIEETLMWGDEIETGEQGSLQITFGSSFLSIGPNTYVTFEKELTDDGEELLLMKLDEGSFRSKILNLGNRQFFEVVTENGRLRVHGTDFVTSFDPESEEPFNVSVLQGRVSLSNPPQENDLATSVPTLDEPEPVLLGQHESGGFSEDGQANDVEGFSLSEANQLKEEYPLPGDDVVSLSIDSLGVAAVDIDTLTENVQESQEQSSGGGDQVLDDIKDDIILDTRFELTIKARIDPDS